MIDRIVLFKLKDDYANDAARAEIAAHSRAVLEKLSQVRSVSVGEPADEAAGQSWDISLVVVLDDLEAVAAYNVDPDHRAYVDDYMIPRVEVRKAWNFTR